MKKIYLILIFAIFSASFAKAQTDWFNHVADERISLKFPLEPRELIKGTYGTALKDSSVAFVFTVVDFKVVANIDSTVLAPFKATREFADQLKGGMKKSLPSVEYQDFKIGTWKGFTSYTSTGLDAKNDKYNTFMVLIGNKLYSLSTIIKPGGDDSITAKYLSTLTIK